MMLTDEEKTNQIISSVQKENLHQQEKLLNYLKEVENSSKELINNTVNFNQIFQMDNCEKSSKCDLILRLKDYDTLKIRKDDTEFVLKLEQIIEEKNIQHCVLLNKVSNDDFYEMEVFTNLLNTNNCYHQVLKEHLKCMYNQLKYLTAAELQKKNSLLNKQINNLSYERITITQMLASSTSSENEFSASAPCLDEFDCVVCMEVQVILVIDDHYS